MTTIIVYVTADDFMQSSPVVFSMLRQRYPITSTDIETYRNGMQYVNIYGEIFELDINDYLDFKNKVVKVYKLRHRGNKLSTLRSFWQHVDFAARMQSERGDNKLPEAYWKKIQRDLEWGNDTYEH